MTERREYVCGCCGVAIPADALDGAVVAAIERRHPGFVVSSRASVAEMIRRVWLYHDHARIEWVEGGSEKVTW